MAFDRIYRKNRIVVIFLWELCGEDLPPAALEVIESKRPYFREHGAFIILNPVHPANPVTTHICYNSMRII